MEEIDLFINNLNTSLNSFNNDDNKFYDYYYIPTSTINIDNIYWKLLLFKMFNLNIKEKNLKNLIYRLGLWCKKFTKIGVNQKYKIIINKNIFIVLYKNKNNLNNINFYNRLNYTN
jgi:hypothetical protein